MNISVCMATFNGERYIKEQLDSILCQLESHDEIIISDDSSYDNTVEIIKSYNDKRIKLIENQQFHSPIFNFENALRFSTQQYIFLADQDDVWDNRKVEVMTQYLNKFDLVISDAIIIDDSGNIIADSFYKLNNSKAGFFRNLFRNSYLGCAMAFNRRILEKALPFPKDLPMHDWWIGLISEIYGRPYFINDTLIKYRRHTNNYSITGERSTYTLSKRINFRMIMLKNLIKKFILHS